MKKGKFLSSLAAAALSVSMLFAPVANSFAANLDVNSGTISEEALSKSKPTETKLVIHKIGTDGKTINGPFEHNGGVLSKDQLKEIGSNPIELNNVEFTIYKVSPEQLATFKAKPEDYNTTKKVEAVEGVTKAETVKTANGLGATANLADGDYWAVESDKPESVTDSKAVPFGITLPLMNSVAVANNAAGTRYLSEVHVYPKNKTKTPTTDKNFDQEKNGETDGVAEDELISDVKDRDVKHDGTETRDKSTASRNLGDKVPYLVETVFPGSTQYEHAFWEDRVTEGLTLNDDVTLTFQTKNEAGEWTTVEEETAGYWKKDPSAADENGRFFKVSLTDKGLNFVNGNVNDVRVQVRYTGTINDEAVSGVEEANDVTFHYGNNPTKGNTPVPTKPVEQRLDFTKEWADGIPVEDDGVKFVLRNAQTGKDLMTVDVLQEGDTADSINVTVNGKPLTDNQLEENGITFKNESVDTEGNVKWNFSFTGLDNETEYKIVETETAGFTAEYKAEDGKITIVDWKEENPNPINPSEPKVVFGGKRFVKTDESKTNAKRLAGAEFVVRDGNGNDAKYLVYKNAENSTEDVNKARKTLYDAIEAYNKLPENEQTADARENINNLQDAYNKAFKEARQQYDWETSTDVPTNAVKLVSDAQGRFEIEGLKYGTYYLEEVRAPQGYAVNAEKQKFEVNSTSYKNHENGVQYTAVDDENTAEVDERTIAAEADEAQQIVNRNLTIPQTGGIGSLIFIVAGLALMGVAFVAMKRRNSYEEA